MLPSTMPPATPAAVIAAVPQEAAAACCPAAALHGVVARRGCDRLRARGHRRGALRAAAEHATEEPAAGLLRLSLALGVLELPLQLLDAVLRLDQRMLLHEGGLGDAVPRLRVAAEQVGDQRIGLPVHRRQRRLGSGDAATPHAAPGAAGRCGGAGIGAGNPLHEL